MLVFRTNFNLYFYKLLKKAVNLFGSFFILLNFDFKGFLRYF